MDHAGGSRMPLVRSASRVEELEVGNIHGPSNTTVYESSGNGRTKIYQPTLTVRNPFS